MSWSKTAVWSVLWWLTLLTSVSTVYSAHSLYTQSTGRVFEQSEVLDHLFITWCTLAFLYYFFLSLMGMSWKDFLNKLIPFAWLGLWVLITLVINTDFPYGAAFWLLLVSTAGFSIPKYLNRNKTDNAND